MSSELYRRAPRWLQNIWRKIPAPDPEPDRAGWNEIHLYFTGPLPYGGDADALLREIIDILPNDARIDAPYIGPARRRP